MQTRLLLKPPVFPLKLWWFPPVAKQILTHEKSLQGSVCLAGDFLCVNAFLAVFVGYFILNIVALVPPAFTVSFFFPCL